MQKRRFHITGASGSGVTTLGAALADRLAIPHADTDDYYWLPTDPPYQQKRPVPERLRLMGEMFLERPGWVLSGSLDGWGDPLIDRFDAVIFVQTATPVRLQRLGMRERQRVGDDVLESGDHPAHAAVRTFLDWAGMYDTAGAEMRSLRRHEAWLMALPCPVIRVNGGLGRRGLVAQVISELNL